MKKKIRMRKGRALGFQIPRENNLMEVFEVSDTVLTHFKTVNSKPETKGGEKSMKNKITNVMALLIVIATAGKMAIESSAGTGINWLGVVLGVATAVIGWFTGKPN